MLFGICFFTWIIVTIINTVIVTEKDIPFGFLPFILVICPVIHLYMLIYYLTHFNVEKTKISIKENFNSFKEKISEKE